MRQNSNNSSGRRTRRAPRRRSDNRDFTSSPKAAPKKTWWQKLISIFSAKPAAKKSSAPSRNSNPATSSAPSAQRSNSRRPESVDVTTPRLYVGNLSFDASESDLQELFNGVGQVVSAEVVTHRHTQRSKGFAFVQMQSVEEALRAVRELHDKDFLGRKLVVSGAKTQEPRNREDEEEKEEAAEPRLAS